MDERKDETKPVRADSPSDEAALTSKARKWEKGGAEMAKEDEIKAAAEKSDQPKAAEPVKEQPKGKVASKVRSTAERLRRNPWR
jgi:hypothetical protein